MNFKEYGSQVAWIITAQMFGQLIHVLVHTRIALSSIIIIISSVFWKFPGFRRIRSVSHSGVGTTGRMDDI